MSESQPQRAASPPNPPFQFTVRTLLLLFVVAALSLGVFGAWGLLVFASVVGLAIYPNAAAKPRSCLEYLLLFWLCLTCLFGMLLRAVEDSPKPGGVAQCINNLQQI